MALASDLMGLGVAPLLAARTANGGTGPLFAGTLPGSTSAFSSLNKIGAFQFVLTVSNGVSTGGICLPSVGGDSGALLADDYVINNSGVTTIFLFCSPGVTLSCSGVNTSFTQLALHTTMTTYPLTTTQWIGVKGT